MRCPTGDYTPWGKMRSVISNAGRAVLKTGMLDAAAGGGPVGKGFEPIAVFPGQTEEGGGVEIGGFFTQKGFKAPLDVRAIPRMKAVAARTEPVELEQVEHAQTDITYWILDISLKRSREGLNGKAAINRRSQRESAAHGDGKMFVDEDPGLAALFPDAGVADRGIEGFAVFEFGGDAHGNGSPGDVAVAGDL